VSVQESLAGFELLRNTSKERGDQSKLGWTHCEANFPRPQQTLLLVHDLF